MMACNNRVVNRKLQLTQLFSCAMLELSGAILTCDWTSAGSFGDCYRSYANHYAAMLCRGMA
jgi:hypothetical protein